MRLFSNLAANHVDYEGNSVLTLWSPTSWWNCELVGKCVLFLVHAGDSACFKCLVVTRSSFSLRNKNDLIMRVSSLNKLRGFLYL